MSYSILNKLIIFLDIFKNNINKNYIKKDKTKKSVFFFRKFTQKKRQIWAAESSTAERFEFAISRRHRLIQANLLAWFIGLVVSRRCPFGRDRLQKASHGALRAVDGPVLPDDSSSSLQTSIQRILFLLRCFLSDRENSSSSAVTSNRSHLAVDPKATCFGTSSSLVSVLVLCSLCKRRTRKASTFFITLSSEGIRSTVVHHVFNLFLSSYFSFTHHFSAFAIMMLITVC